MPDVVRTTCPYCGVGCGVLAFRRPDGAVGIKGDPEHPSNFGRLCSKGSALGETVDLDGRLLSPKVRGKMATWDDALNLVAKTFTETIDADGPDSVAFYVSGQLLTEDYYAANKLMKGFIGSANIDTNSRLCMASSVAGHSRAFGSDTVPGNYEDLELADLVVLVGSNLAWCHPVLYQRIAEAKERSPGMRVVVIDPRRTMTADLADLHLAIAPDGDVALFNGLLSHLARSGRLNRDYIRRHTNSFAEALAAARQPLQEVADQTGLPVDELTQFFDLFAATEKTVTVYSQGVNQSRCGTDKVNAIINCHLATGRIGWPGMGPFSVTGQPNAMGGRETGGLANMLAAHMAIENETHRDIVQRFWHAPTVPAMSGLKAVDLLKAVADGRIKALWIMATNPVDSMPEADAVAAALEVCDFVVVSDVMATTDTLRYAHVALPSAAWGEKDGTVTSSERRISRQRAFLPLPGEARPDWWQITQVARRMGFANAFAWESPAQIFAEYAELTAFENGGTRDLDLGAYAGITPPGYDALKPFQWPRPARVTSLSNRFFGSGGFFTSDGRARFVPVTVPEAELGDGRYPLILNTGRVRDQWHTMTRTGKSVRLSAHMAEPYAEIHPADAAKMGIGDADLIEVESKHALVRVRALVTPRVAPGALFVPMHWNDQNSALARVSALIAAATDPLSGQPALKKTHVTLRRFDVKVFGFAVCRERPQVDHDYWTSGRIAGGWRLEFAHGRTISDIDALATQLFGGDAGLAMVQHVDRERSIRRVAAFDKDRLVGAFFLSPDPVEVSRSWACDLLSYPYDDARSRWRVAAGRPGADLPERGAIICSCFQVGSNDIAAAIRAGSYTVEAVGRATCAGTNCGSCKAEIREILHEHRVIAAE